MDASSNQTMSFCPPYIDMYIKNLTSSYTEKSNEASMVSASVIMFVLAGLFFNLNLFSGISDVSATLHPKVRLFLSSALNFQLTVMSYLFSEAKNAATAGASFSSSATSGRAVADLSTGARMILVWMLLVELLRKKVDEIRMRGFSSSIQRAVRVVWLGSLVFFNIRSTGRKALFAILWILCATRVVQRIVYNEIDKKSYAHGKNARLINSYMMAKRLEQQADDKEHQARHDDDVEQAPGQVKIGGELLESCSYIVMGEEKMVLKPTADGYDVGPILGDVITVGDIWKLNENDDIFASPRDREVQRLKRLCLSFALFKLLRRKFERLPAVTVEEAKDCSRLIFRGLLELDDSPNAAGSSVTETAAEKVFQVMNDEVVFLSEYYHSVVPVVLASPFFLFVNYFLVLAVVAALCVMTVILCGNGDAVYAFTSIGNDNYTFRSGIGRIAICLILKAKNSPEAFFSIVNLSITLLLFVIYFYEEIWEFFVFLLSNWFMVSLVCSYMAKDNVKQSSTDKKSHWCGCPWIRYAFRLIIWLRSKLNHGSLSFRQFSVLHHRWLLGLPFFSKLSLVLGTEPVPKYVMQSIVERLWRLDPGHCAGGSPAYLTPPTNGEAAKLRIHFDKHEHPSEWEYSSHSVSEVFLTCHIATCILETEWDRPQQQRGDKAAAVSLSMYCAYLVAFRPELLPDSPDKTKRAVKDMKAEWKDYLMRSQSQHKQAQKIMKPGEIMDTTKDQEAPEDPEAPKDQEAKKAAPEDKKVVTNGAELAHLLLAHRDDAWTVLKDVWTELIVFVAASSDEERVKGHQDVLVQGGGEFITVLWALTTHIGVPHLKKLPVKKTLMGESKRHAPTVTIAPEITSVQQ